MFSSMHIVISLGVIYGGVLYKLVLFIFNVTGVPRIIFFVCDFLEGDLLYDHGVRIRCGMDTVVFIVHKACAVIIIAPHLSPESKGAKCKAVCF